MTKALREAFEEASALPDGEQDALAAAIRAELDAERAWESSFSGSGATLERLADEALEEHRAGRTQPFDLTER